MRQEEFRKQFEIASALVETWPVWKQNILEYSSQSTVSVPRTPVDNPRISAATLNNVKSHSSYPKLDILKTDGKYKIEVAVPGVQPNDLKVEILPDNNGERMVRISGKMAHDYQHSKETEFHFRELCRTKFQRVILLPNEVQGDPEAVIQNGMLTLTWQILLKSNVTDVKQIPIKTI